MVRRLISNILSKKKSKSYSDERPTTKSLRDQAVELASRPLEVFLNERDVPPAEKARLRLERIGGSSLVESQSDSKKCTVGKHCDWPDDKFDAEQLKRGVQVEYEHTGDYDLAKEIAKDHLAELPDYYSRLERMERTPIKPQWQQDVDEMIRSGKGYGHIVNYVANKYPNVGLWEYTDYVGGRVLRPDESHADMFAGTAADTEKYLITIWGRLNDATRMRLLADSNVPNEALARERRWDALPNDVRNAILKTITDRAPPGTLMTVVVPLVEEPSKPRGGRAPEPEELEIRSNVERFISHHWGDITTVDREAILRDTGVADLSYAKHKWSTLPIKVRNKIVQHYSFSDSEISTYEYDKARKWWEQGTTKETFVCPNCGSVHMVRQGWTTFTCFECGTMTEHKEYDQGRSERQARLPETSANIAESMTNYVMENWIRFTPATRLKLLKDSGVPYEQLAYEADWHALPADVKFEIIQTIRSRAAPGVTIEEVVPEGSEPMGIIIPTAPSESKKRGRKHMGENFLTDFISRHWEKMDPKDRTFVIKESGITPQMMSNPEKWDCLSEDAKKLVVNYYFMRASRSDFSAFDFDTPDDKQFASLIGFPLSESHSKEEYWEWTQYSIYDTRERAYEEQEKLRQQEEALGKPVKTRVVSLPQGYELQIWTKFYRSKSDTSSESHSDSKSSRSEYSHWRLYLQYPTERQAKETYEKLADEGVQSKIEKTENGYYGVYVFEIIKERRSRPGQSKYESNMSVPSYCIDGAEVAFEQYDRERKAAERGLISYQSQDVDLERSLKDMHSIRQAYKFASMKLVDDHYTVYGYDRRGSAPMMEYFYDSTKQLQSGQSDSSTSKRMRTPDEIQEDIIYWEHRADNATSDEESAAFDRKVEYFTSEQAVSLGLNGRNTKMKDSGGTYWNWGVFDVNGKCWSAGESDTEEEGNRMILKEQKRYIEETFEKQYTAFYIERLFGKSDSSSGSASNTVRCVACTRCPMGVTGCTRDSIPHSHGQSQTCVECGVLYQDVHPHSKVCSKGTPVNPSEVHDQRMMDIQMEWEVSKSVMPKKECPTCTSICNALGDAEWCKLQFQDLREKRITDKELASKLDQRYGPGWEDLILRKKA